MKKYAKLTAIFLAAAMLFCGCEKIADESGTSSVPESSVTSSDNTSASVPERNKDSYRPAEHSIIRRSYTVRLEAEKAATDGTARNMQGGLLTGDGEGYVSLNKGQYFTQVPTLMSSQFYRVILMARSQTGATISLSVGDTPEGSYYIPKDTETNEFGLYAVDCLYMSVGMNALKFSVENGTAEVDCIIIEDSDSVSSSAYDVGGVCVTPNASVKTLSLLQLLTNKYGDAVFAAQNVSCGSNAEIDAVFIETKRFPAIRTSELALALKDDPRSADIMNDELDLAKKWSADGGIVSYVWHWYSPNDTRGTGAGDFDLAAALDGVDPSELALLDENAIQLQLDNDLLSHNAAALVKDLDRLAETLKPLADADIPIIFEPIPDGDSGLFWWGSDAESYKALWELTFNRLTKHNGLKNIIWVWNNSDFELYPGDSYVDIIGQSFYESTTSSFAGRFGALAADTRTGRKAIAVTACGTLPGIDNMSRDNAMWLWVALDSGEYTIDSSGRLSEKYTKKSALRVMYNNEKVITLDELNY